MQSPCVRSFGRALGVVAALAVCAPAPDAYGAICQQVQSGTATNNTNGIQSITISSIDMTKSILIFQARSNSNRPVGSEVRGRLASATTIEFVRVTDEGAPAAINIQWYVATFGSGVRVQRGEVAQSGTTTDQPITAVASVNQAFVLWSKTSVAADATWGSDDAVLGELTSTTNLQFRANMLNAGHIIAWQVVEFTNAADINVQKGSITTMTGATTSVTATLATPVDPSKTFVLAGVRITDGTPAEIGTKLVRAQLTNSTTVTFDRSVGALGSDISEIVWQAIELKDGSQVWGGSATFGGGVASTTATLGNVVNTTRAVALISTQGGGGQNTGRSPYVGDDIVGVGSATVALTAASNQITLNRDNTAAAADVGFFVVQFNGGSPFKVGSFTKTTGTGPITQTFAHGLGQQPKALIVWTEGRTNETFSNATGIGLRAAASAGAAAGVQTLTINVPTGTVQNDGMMASIAVRPNTAVVITPPAGWVLISRTDNGGATTPNSLAIYGKIATAAEPASYSWSFDIATTGSVGGIVSFSGVDTTSPFDTLLGQNTPSGTSHTAPSVTTTMANDMIVTVHSFASAETWTPPAGMTEAVDASSVPTPSAAGQSMEINYVVQAAVAATGVKTATVGGNADAGNAYTIALRAATQAYFGYGMSDGTTSKSLSASMQNYADTTNAASKIANKVLTIVKWDGAGITLAEADLQSWDDTNITFNWTTNDAYSYVVHYIAIGGTDLSAKVIGWTMGNATGNRNVTGVGFQPNLVIHAHGGYLQTAAPPSIGLRGAFGLGAMDGDGNQWATQFFTRDALGTSSTQRGQQTDAAIYSFNETLTVQKKASFVSMNVDGFTLNFTNATSANNAQAFSLALKGLNGKVGNFLKTTAAAPASQPITGANFAPAAVLFTSMQDGVQANPVAESRFGIGASDGTTEGSSAFFDQNAAGVSNVAGIDKTSKAFVKVNNTTPVIDAEADLTSMDVDGFTLNWTTNDAVQTQILYLAMAPMAVTEVRLTSLAAAKYNRGVLVQWRTGYEIDNLGFNVYRELNGVRTKVNASLIRGSGLQAGQGGVVTAERNYARWDLNAAASDPAATYWLEDVEFNGKSKFHGPISPVVSQLQEPSTVDSAELGDISNATSSKRIFFNYSDDPVSRGPRVGPPQVPSEVVSQWALAATATVKMGIRKPGWYRVTQPELVNAGLNSNVDPRTLQLFVDGTEQAIRVTGEIDGRFDAADAIEFYGSGIDTAYTNTRTYWLQAGAQPGRRIAVDAGGSSAPSTLTGFSSTLRRKDRTVYFAALKNGDTENWFGPTVVPAPGVPDPNDPWAPVALTLTPNHIDRSTAGPAQLNVSLQGVTTTPDGGANHLVGVLINGTDVGEMTFAGQNHAEQTFPVAVGLLLDGENTVTLVARGGAADSSLVDAIRLDYPHSYQADADRLRLTVDAPGSITIGGFASAAIRVFDITDRTTPVELPGTVGAAAGLSTVTVRVPGAGSRTLMAFSDETVASPDPVRVNRPSTLHANTNAYDYVVISHGAFTTQVAPLAALRQQQGHQTVVVDVEDVYDEFSFGEKTPQAIKDFLRWARTNWATVPRFVVLVGDATIDPRDYEGLGDADFVPTKQVPMSQVALETASDDWFVDFADNGLPEVAIGRLSVRTAAQAAAIVAKIVGYDQAAPQPWTKNVLLVADRNDDTSNFEQLTQSLTGLVPPGYTAHQVYSSAFGDAVANQAITNQVNSGQLIVNYVGHGSSQLWGTSGQLLKNDDVTASWRNATRLPFVVAMNCLNGLFQGVWDEASLAEAMQRAPDGGAVAVWASSSTTPPATQALVNRELFRLIFEGAYPTVGEAVAAAKRVVSQSDLRRSWILFGDPAMHLSGASDPTTPAPPRIVTSPVSQSIGSGQSATLSVVAAGSAPFSYQWYVGLTGTTTTPIAGATSASYTTPSLTSTTSYWVRVSNAYAPPADSATATITIGSPTIATPPVSQMIELGHTAILDVVAEGRTPLSYQWYVGAPGTTTTPLAGATSAGDTTPALTSTTSYWVRVCNPYGCADSSGATISVVSNNVLVTDSFTAGSGTLLPAHAPDVNLTGAPWTVTGGSPTPTLGNGVVAIGPGGGHRQVTIDSGVADIAMSVDYHVGTGPGMGALAFRLTDSANHLMLVTYENRLQFYRHQAGTYALLASQPLAAFAAGSTHRLEVRATGSALEGWWDGARVLQVSEPFQQTATRHGLDWNTAYDATTTYDAFELRVVGPLPAPPATPTAPLPAIGATSVVMPTALSWSAPGATSYDVRFGTTNPPPSAATGIGSASYRPTGLTASAVYFWQVTARNTAGSTSGPVWSFRTAAAPVDLLVQDTFTGTPATALPAHTADVNLTGAPWTVTGGSPTPTLGNGVVAIGPGGGHRQVTIDSGVADIAMSVDYHVGTGPGMGALAFRLTDSNNHLMLVTYGNQLQLYRRQAGNYALLASQTLAAITSGSTHRLEVRATGSALEGWWDGVRVLQVSEPFQQTATRHGLDWNTAYDTSTTYDDFELRMVGPLPSPPATPTAPLPAAGAASVAMPTGLMWSASGATSYDVNFGTTNEPPLVATGLNSASYRPTGLTASTVYFWHVTARNAAGSTTGPLWSFTTAALPADLLVQDTFTGTPGTVLPAHTPDVNLTGAPWTVAGGSPTPTLGNGVVAIGPGGGHLQATIDSGVADIAMGVDYHVGAGPGMGALAFRLTDSNNHLVLVTYENRLQFYRRQAGSYTLLASQTLAAIAAGSTHRLEVRATGNTVEGWWDGVRVLQVSEPFQRTATRHGLDWNTAYDPLTTYGNFQLSIR